MDRTACASNKIGGQLVSESDLQFRLASIADTVLKTLRNGLVRNVFSSEFVQPRFRLRMTGLHATS